MSLDVSSTYLNLLKENYRHGCVHEKRPIKSRFMPTARPYSKLIRDGSFCHSPLRASVFVAVTSRQPRQERRKLEIRSSSHKSLQSPKGPQNTSNGFPSPQIRHTCYVNSAPTFLNDTLEDKHTLLVGHPNVYEWISIRSIFSKGATAIIRYVCKMSF